MQILHLALSCDDRYAKYAAVTIFSAGKTLKGGWALDVVVINSGLSQNNRDLLLRAVGNRGQARFHHIAPESYKDLPVMEHWSTAMYYRFAIDDAVPTGSRCVYLDCDTLVQRSLHELVEMDLKGAALGVVEEPLSKRGKQLGINRTYFNSGVLLYDLDVWRRSGFTAKAIEVALKERQRLVCPDQDVLNIAMADDVCFIDPAWNVQLAMFASPRYWRVAKNPAIIHFTTNVKPWHRADPHPFAREYRALAEELQVDFTDDGGGAIRTRLFVRWVRRFSLYFIFAPLTMRVN